MALEPEQAELLAAITDGRRSPSRIWRRLMCCPYPAEAKKAPNVEKQATSAQTHLI